MTGTFAKSADYAAWLGEVKVRIKPSVCSEFDIFWTGA